MSAEETGGRAMANGTVYLGTLVALAVITGTAIIDLRFKTSFRRIVGWNSGRDAAEAGRPRPPVGEKISLRGDYENLHQLRRPLRVAGRLTASLWYTFAFALSGVTVASMVFNSVMLISGTKS